MSKALSRVLEQPEEAIAHAIARLEEKNGYPSHDVRASADNIQKIRRKMQELGLDPDDTTAAELYHSLLVKFQTDARKFDEHFGMFSASYDQKIKLAVELVAGSAELPERWVLKPTAAKKLLRQHPPKQLMKRLRYRSVESFIKRQNIAEVYLAIEFVESAAWNKAHFKLASELETTAFEMRQLKLQALKSNWGPFRSDDVYVSSGDYGVLGLSPGENLWSASLLMMVVLLLDKVGAKSSSAAKLSPAAAWWSETDHLIADLAGTPVSLNLKDIALNHAAKAEAEAAERSGGQRHFWKDLIGRYENQLPAEEDVLSRLEAPVLNIRLPLNQPAFEYAEDI
jgi:hypothetical protein